MQIQATDGLPSAFQNIKFIPSAIMREELTRAIVDINMIIKETEAFAPEPELVTITNRFFSYLTSSCASRSLVLRRAKWILTVAKIVRARQVEFSYRHHVQRIEDYTHVMYADMVDMIADIAEKTSEYVQRSHPTDHYQVTETIMKIVEVAGITKPSQSQHYYTTLKKYGDEILSNLDMALKHKDIGLALNPDDLTTRLQQFLYCLRAYRHRVTAH